MRIKRFFAAATAFAIAVPLLGLHGTTAFGVQSDIDITLFSLSSSYADFISIPDDEPVSYSISSDDSAAKYRVISGNSVTVSAEGVIEPAYTVWYWNGSFGSTVSSGAEDEVVEKRPKIGDSVVEVTDADGTYRINVTVKEYGEYYADSVIRSYVEENISGDMTTEEKLNAVAKLPATYDYSPYASGYVSMIVRGGGDCWGSVGIIIEELKLLGINGWIRNANRDSGAGSGHRNVIAEVDGEYYELEAGYTGKAPRPYHVTKRSSLFCFRQVTGGYAVYQYDGNSKDDAVLEIPSQYNGKPVVGLEKSAFSSMSGIEEIVLPDTLVYIEPFAFFGMSDLRKVTLPDSLETIAGGAFADCGKLEEIAVGEDNPSFATDGKALYNSDFTELVLIFPAVSDYNVPETVTVIREQASRYNRERTSITIPGSVKTIEEGAFHGCDNLETVILSEGIEAIGDYAFAATPKLKRVIVPDSVTSIGNSAFGIDIYGSTLEGFVLCGSEGSEAQRYAEETGINFEIYSGEEEDDDTVPGDSNCDGEINLADAVLIMQYMANPVKYGPTAENGITEQGLINADINGDGVTNLDALTIQRFLLGAIKSLKESA